MEYQELMEQQERQVILVLVDTEAYQERMEQQELVDLVEYQGSQELTVL